MNPVAVPIADPQLQAFVSDVVASGAFANPGEYIAALIEEDRRRRAKAKLEALLLESLQEEPTEVADKDWDEMRQQYDERHFGRNGQ
jgi:Arc/MetJ-type ribon-helix-helix transcriptional regulator